MAVFRITSQLIRFVGRFSLRKLLSEALPFSVCENWHYLKSQK